MTAAPEREVGHELTGALHDSTGSYELVIAAIAAGGFGFLIDRAFGIVPVFTLIFAIAGFIGAGYSIWLRYRDEMAVANADRAARTGPGGRRPEAPLTLRGPAGPGERRKGEPQASPGTES